MSSSDTKTSSSNTKMSSSDTKTNHYLSREEIVLSRTCNPAPTCAIYGAPYAICAKKKASRCRGLYAIRDGVYVCGYCAFGLNWKR